MSELSAAANDGEDLLETAGLWCVRLDEGALSPAEQSAFESWLAADPANPAALERVTSTWRLAYNLKASPELIVMRSQALERARQANQFRWAKSAMVLGRRSVIAASFILIVAGLATSWFAYAPRSYVTGIGERRIVVLSDGSRLSLDAATEVDVRFHDSSRQLWLKRGRANFNVAKDALRPFSVAVGRTVVVATGTEFSVEVVGGQVHVVLVEGRVAILKDQGAATGRTHVDLTPISGSGGGQGVQADHYLTPGRELIMSAKAGDAHILPVDPQRSLSWESGQLIFSDEPLQTAVDRVNRYTKSPIMVGDGRAAAIPISGVFAAGDTQAFINGVTAVFPVHLAVTDHRRMLVSGGAPNG